MSKPLNWPKWFDWPWWGCAIGSDERYQPRWYERRAYVMGLRDAARIVEHERWVATKIGEKDIRFVEAPSKLPRGLRRHRSKSETLKLATGRFIIHGIHNYVRRFMGLPVDTRRLGDPDDTGL
jgi:hypothetical protein